MSRRPIDRRAFLGQAAAGLGAAAFGGPLLGAVRPLLQDPLGHGAHLDVLHHAPRAKRVIWLFMSGAPSQIDLWDPKPAIHDRFDQDLPESIRQGQRLTTMTSEQDRFPVAPSIYKFAQHGQAGTWVSELLPHTAKVVDDLCVVRSMFTEAINHDPAITFIQTGSEQPGRPSAGAWLSYGLGSRNADLPPFVILHAKWSATRDAQSLFSRLWGAGFLPSSHQGVSLRADGDPVLYLSDPPGIDRANRRRILDRIVALNDLQHQREGDPETLARSMQYEMAYRMQAAVPELTDFSDEPQHVLDLYGPSVHEPGSFAYQCLLARRLAERDVRFTQVFHRGWDHHEEVPRHLPLQCGDIDQASAALVTDLKQRGLLEDTLVVWGGEFGRTVYCQGPLTRENYGRDHHPRCFTMWMAGGGSKPGTVYGATDDFSYNIVENPVHVHDLNATILHMLGVDHKQLTYRYQGRDHRLTDVHGNVIRGLLA